MDLQAITGLALIAAALVLGSIVLASGASGENGGPRFFSIPKQKRDWLRLPLIALTAYIVGVLLFSRFGYTIPGLRAFHADIVLRYPLVLLGAASVATLFVERRLGIVFTVISVLLGIAIFYAPAPGSATN